MKILNICSIVILAIMFSNPAHARMCLGVDLEMSSNTSFNTAFVPLCGGKCNYKVQAVGGGDCYRDVNGEQMHTCSVNTKCKSNQGECGCNPPTNAQVGAALPGCELNPNEPVTFNCQSIVPLFSRELIVLPPETTNRAGENETTTTPYEAPLQR